MSATDILLERETANDESATVVAVYILSGARVEKDEVLFDIENSKATQEVVAPEGGVLSHNLEVGDTVSFGVPIASVLSVENGPRKSPAQQDAGVASPMVDASVSKLLPAQSDVRPAPPASSGREQVTSNPRFSHAAAKVLIELGLTPAHFSAGFVTVKDVRARAGQPQPDMRRATSSTISPVDAVAADLKTAGKAIGPRKRAEIDTLSNGPGATMLSVLGISLGSLTIARAKDHFLNGRITDLVIYEASRLMRKFPKLNSFYADGKIVEHQGVHAGLAIDDGGRLVVYGIQDADRAGLNELAEAISDAVARYVNNELTASELSRATFTVTDLSADELDFVFPLLPRGQSCIIGITHSQLSGFRLYTGFDHRVTEGREVAGFLGELRDRLLSFASTKQTVAPQEGAKAVNCIYCARSAGDAVMKNREKGLLKIVDREGRDAFCCASCWNGW